jgi:hypothetical protein
MKWFKHDSNARHDAKLAKLRMKYGLEGYGLYFFLLECISGTVEAHNLTFELEEDAELIASMTNIHYERIQEMMSYMVSLRLFEQAENGVITCRKLSTRTDEYTQKLLRSPDKVRTMSRQTPDSVPIKSLLIEENRIEEKRVDKPASKSKRFVPPSLSDVREFVSEHEYNVDSQSFHDFYESKGWMVGKNKMKDWKAAVRQWNTRNNKDKKEEQIVIDYQDAMWGAR